MDNEYRHYPQAAQVLFGLWGVGLAITVPILVAGLVTKSWVLFNASAIVFLISIVAGLFGGILLGSLGYEPPPIKWLRNKTTD